MNSVKMRKTAKPKTGARRPKTVKPYHHGNLREKLIAATEVLILEKGVDGFSLREVARRAGVSPAAPAHHFGDTKGLLSEVAKRGYADFGDVLAAADARGGSDPAKRLNEQGLAYVTFAMKNPARFALMFRADKIDVADEEFQKISGRSFATLESAIRAATGTKPEDELPPDGFGLLMAVWSIVHGFSHLALGGELDHPARARGGKEAILKSFLPLTLKHLPIGSNSQKAR